MITVMYTHRAPSPQHLTRLEALAGGEHVQVIHSEEEALAHAAETRIILGHRYLRQIMPHAPHLCWVQSIAGGVDALPCEQLAQRGILLTRNPGNSDAIAHHAIALAWAMVRRLPVLIEAQRIGVWSKPPAMLPLPRRALVLGLGAVGLRLARMLRGMGLQVRGCATSGSAEQRAACDEFIPVDAWRQTLGTSDLVFLCMPLTQATRGIFGAAEITALPSHAIIVNIARAAMLDLPALVTALQKNRLGGAAIDVLDPIPPPDDPLWRVPNLLISPKAAAYHPDMQTEFELFVEAQLKRFLAGVPLEAVFVWNRLSASGTR